MSQNRTKQIYKKLQIQYPKGNKKIPAHVHQDSQQHLFVSVRYNVLGYAHEDLSYSHET